MFHKAHAYGTQKENEQKRDQKIDVIRKCVQKAIGVYTFDLLMSLRACVSVCVSACGDDVMILN